MSLEYVLLAQIGSYYFFKLKLSLSVVKVSNSWLKLGVLK